MAAALESNIDNSSDSVKSHRHTFHNTEKKSGYYKPLVSWENNFFTAKNWTDSNILICVLSFFKWKARKRWLSQHLWTRPVHLRKAQLLPGPFYCSEALGHLLCFSLSTLCTHSLLLFSLLPFPLESEKHRGMLKAWPLPGRTIALN